MATSKDQIILTMVPKLINLVAHLIKFNQINQTLMLKMNQITQQEANHTMSQSLQVPNKRGLETQISNLKTI